MCRCSEKARHLLLGEGGDDSGAAAPGSPGVQGVSPTQAHPAGFAGAGFVFGVAAGPVRAVIGDQHGPGGLFLGRPVGDVDELDVLVAGCS